METQRAVRAGAGQHNANGAALLVLRQGAEKDVDGEADVGPWRSFQEMQGAMLERHVPVRRGNVDQVGLQRHPIGSLTHWHSGTAAQELRQQTDMGGGLMRHHHKRHATVRRHMTEKDLKGLQTPSGCPETHDGEGAHG